MVIGQSNKWICTKHGPFADMEADEHGIQSNISFPECPVCQVIREKDLCRECEQHPATINFSDSAMSYVHGFFERICRCCHVARMEKHFAEVTTNLSKAKEDLLAHPCVLQGPDPL